MSRTNRQRSTWGCIQRMGTAKYRVRWMGDEGDGTGYRRRSATLHCSRKEARAFLSAKEARHGEERCTPTLGEAHDRWWMPEAVERLQSGDLARNTFDLYAVIWRKHIEPTWGGTQVDAIRPVEVQDWLLTLTRWNAVNAKSLAGAVADRAVLLGLADSNPFRRPYRMPRAVEEREKAVWKLSEVKSAMDALRGTCLEVPAILCGLGSCRVGEACAVRADEVSVSVEANGMRIARVPICRQLVKRNNDIQEALKNPQSVRPVCIPEPWSLRLDEIAKERRANGLHWLNDDGTGQPVPRARIQRQWGAMFRDGKPLSGFTKIPMRNLRNSWETFMRWELNVAPDLIDSMMGHVVPGARGKNYDRPDENAYSSTCAKAYRGEFI